MSTLSKYLMSVLLLLVSVAGLAQKITNSSYQTIGHIKSDGTIQDKSYKIAGHIKSDGTVQDASYRTIGYVKSDGSVQNASYRTIGHAKDIPAKWAAFYFFFSAF